MIPERVQPGDILEYYDCLVLVIGDTRPRFTDDRSSDMIATAAYIRKSPTANIHNRIGAVLTSFHTYEKHLYEGTLTDEECALVARLLLTGGDEP